MKLITLTEWEQDFFRRVADHVGPLREWQLAQLKTTLRGLTDEYTPPSIPGPQSGPASVPVTTSSPAVAAAADNPAA